MGQSPGCACQHVMNPEGDEITAALKHVNRVPFPRCWLTNLSLISDSDQNWKNPETDVDKCGEFPEH